MTRSEGISESEKYEDEREREAGVQNKRRERKRERQHAVHLNVTNRQKSELLCSGGIRLYSKRKGGRDLTIDDIVKKTAGETTYNYTDYNICIMSTIIQYTKRQNNKETQNCTAPLLIQ